MQVLTSYASLYWSRAVAAWRPRPPSQPALAAGRRTVNPLGVTARDTDYLAMLKWTVEDAGRVFGVPVPLLNILDNATLSNVEAYERIFWSRTITPRDEPHRP